MWDSRQQKNGEHDRSSIKWSRVSIQVSHGCDKSLLSFIVDDMMSRSLCEIKHANSLMLLSLWVVMYPNQTRSRVPWSSRRLPENGAGPGQASDAARPSTFSRHIGCRAETAGTLNTSFRVKKSGILTKFASEKINETRASVCEAKIGVFWYFWWKFCDISPTVPGQLCFVLTKSYLAAAVHGRK